MPVRIEGLNRIELTPRRLELRRLAAAGRAMIEHLVSTKATVGELTDAADRLEAVAEMLAALPTGQSYEGFAETAVAGATLSEGHGGSEPDGWDPERFAFFDHSPVIGLANPTSPPIVLDYAGDRVTGRVVFGSAYEGPPGCVHGGYVAAAFDELLGAAQSLSGAQGMTARLEVDYRSPTPLRTELTLVGRLSRREGRKIYCTGTIHAGDQLCAEAEGLFVSFEAGGFRAMLASREERMG